MPTKTDRILSYLPGTFRALLPVTGQPSALYSIADAVGEELQQAENKLAEIMLAHWVDTADRGAEQIEDLASIADLYGLKPRDDESVEEFRRHLLRYIRTFLEGTVTVQGIFRVAAEALGLEIADSYAELDTWWKRLQDTGSDALAALDPDPRDAASMVFGLPAMKTVGHSPKPARVEGSMDLRDGANLQDASILRLQVDEAATQEIELLQAGDDARHVPLEAIIERLNAVFEPLLGAPVASSENHRLVITSPSAGPASRLEFEEGERDAGSVLLGLPPLTYFGRLAQPATVTGQVDLSGDLDLRQARYLRLVIDGSLAAEVDCGGDTPGHRSVEEVRDAINGALGIEVAAVVEREGAKYLALTSTTTGNDSSIAFQPAPAQDAAQRLFGALAPVYLGSDDAAATFLSPLDLGEGIDLSVRFNIRLSVDDGVPLTINCAGLRPANTTLAEIVNAINAAVGSEIARREGRFLRLTSPNRGAGSQLRFETPDEADATELLFSLPPRTRHGNAPTSARIVGRPELDQGVDLRARHLLCLRVDGNAPVTADLRSHAANQREALLTDLANSIQAAVGPGTATDDGLHLVLASPTVGAGSSLEVLPLEVARQRRYVNRAIITGEAAQAILGFNQEIASGTAATRARLVGQADLSRGVDLRQGRYLRLSVDGHSFIDVDCAGPRPRATLLSEVVDKINAALRPEFEADIAASDGKHLLLISPTSGSTSQIILEAPHAQDALGKLLGLSPGSAFGSPSAGVRVVGIPDLSSGVDLPAHAAIKVGLDGAAPVEIALTGDDPAHLVLGDLLVAISLALGSGVASQDGRHLILASTKQDSGAQVVFEAPSATDATAEIFGFPAPRSYQGVDALPAVFLGGVDLSGEQDLSVARFLRVGVDAKAPIDIDCGGADPDQAAHASLAEVVARINTALKADVALAEGDRLKLVSPTAGVSSRLVLEYFTGGDARAALLGSVADSVQGQDPQPATVTGQVQFVSPVDLSDRSLLRIAVDSGRALEIDVRGARPETTFLAEIVARINDYFPGLASATPEDYLRLTSPTAGEESQVAVLPMRYLELIEYPSVQETMPTQSARHGATWSVINTGAGEAPVEAFITAPSGASGATLVNGTVGWQVQLLANILPGDTAHLYIAPDGSLQAELVGSDGIPRRVPPEQIVSGPLGGQVLLPFQGEWRLTGGSTGATRLQLNNPLSPWLLELRTLKSGASQPAVWASVIEAAPAELPDLPQDGATARLVGRVRSTAEGWTLEGPGGSTMARLQIGLAGDFEAYRDRVAALAGPVFAGEPALLIVEAAELLFDLALRGVTPAGETVLESYPGVAAGDLFSATAAGPGSLAWQVNLGPGASQLARVAVLAKSSVLRLPRGRSRWRYLDCSADRYNADPTRFGRAHFAGGICREGAIFNISRFSNSPPEKIVAVFTPSQADPAPPVQIGMKWDAYRPGAFQVNLPADLPEKFGGRFNLARFSRQGSQPEVYERVVTEPPGDEDYLVKRIQGVSELVVADTVPRVPLGWEAIPMPFRKPRYLTLGSEETPARLYLSEEGINGFIELRAKTEGDWGNAISVTARKVGPALFEVTIAYQGARFESARQIVSGPALPELVADVLKPAPVGVLLARAAGIYISVTREGTG